MTNPVSNLGQARVYSYSGARIENERSFTDLIGEALGARADWLAIPTDKLSADFFTLSTRLAGDCLQKAVNYGLKVAILGPIPEAQKKSEALAAFVRESNRGRHIWFVETEAEFEARLSQ